jgi:hypothetical protein
MHSSSRIALAAAAAMLAGAALAQSNSELNPNRHVHHRVNDGSASNEAPTAGGTTSLTPISNHGGPVMVGQPNVHVIWYGNWNQSNGSDTPAGQQIIRDLIAGLSGSNYLGITKSYSSTNGAVSGLLGTYNEGVDTGSQGTRLSDARVQSIVSKYITSKGAADPNAIYFVLTSTNVSESSGFCNQYCGWHTSATISGQTVKYSFVGNANRCLASCAAQTTSPNGNPGVDGMASVVSHELEETLSDPQANAWYDASGAENADKCAWTFGSNQKTAANGSSYNQTLGGRNFLIQRNLSAVDNKCYTDYANKLQ